jgi:hypothetical protein
MDHLSGPKITGRMVEEVVNSESRKDFRLWLVCDEGVWNVVVAGSVDGNEEHVLTLATVLSQTPRRRGRCEYELAAGIFNSMFFKP